MAIKDINGLKIKGGCYTVASLLDFGFSVNNNNNQSEPVTERRISIMYGKNGSGKTTISRAFSKLKSPTIEHENGDVVEIYPQISQYELFDKDEHTLYLTPAEKQNIHVFNENFVDNKFRTNNEGLETIVIFDEQEKATKSYEKEKATFDNLNEQLETATSAMNSAKRAADDFKKKLRTIMKEGGGWADRLGISRIDSKYLDNIINLTELPTKGYDALKQEFDKTVKYSSPNALPPALLKGEVPKFALPYTEKELRELLAMKIDASQCSAWSILMKEPYAPKDTEKMVSKLIDSNTEICPYCLQKITHEHRDFLEKQSTAFFNNIEDRLRSKLQWWEDKSNISSFDVSTFKYFELAEGAEYDDCYRKLKIYQAAVWECRNAISEKLKNIRESYELGNVGLDKKYQDFLVSREKFVVAVNSYNKDAAEYNTKNEENRNRLEMMNNQLVYLLVKDDIPEYKENISKIETQQKEISRLSVLIGESKQKTDKLKQAADNVQIAYEDINKNLQYVFASQKTLQLEPGENCYKLKCNGKDIAPRDLSTGERNIIGLCYFFASIMKDSTKRHLTKTPHLFIIDDPVSSFDIENRVGVLTLIKYKLKAMLKHPETRILLLSHDLYNCYELVKTFEVFGRANGIKHIVIAKQLKEGKTSKYEFDKNNEYLELLQTIYEFATQKGATTTSAELYIGNMMRRALETFSTAQYKMDFESVQDNEIFVWRRVKKGLREQLQNYMTRCILHGQSHAEGRIRYSIDVAVLKTFGYKDLKKTAIYVLCFMYVLNPKHIIAHLAFDKGNIKKDIIKQFDAWCIDIENGKI